MLSHCCQLCCVTSFQKLTALDGTENSRRVTRKVADVKVRKQQQISRNVGVGKAASLISSLFWIQINATAVWHFECGLLETDLPCQWRMKCFSYRRIKLMTTFHKNHLLSLIVLPIFLFVFIRNSFCDSLSCSRHPPCSNFARMKNWIVNELNEKVKMKDKKVRIVLRWVPVSWNARWRRRNLNKIRGD